jgi:hypothetical protein
MNHWQNNPFVLGVMVYVMLETILYIPTLIFASDLFQNRVLTKIDVLIT